MDSGLPPRIGPYEPLELLAEGGMARVVVARRAEVEGPEPFVALKLIRPELAADETYVTMFLDEARLNSRVRHPNVVEILDVGKDERTGISYIAMELVSYIAMELVLGATLAELMRRASAPIPTPIALEIVAQADAAHVATAADGTPLAMVHRDVSPQNLLVGFDGIVRVSDFGVARAAQRATRTKTGQFKGKLAYCSPEQAMGLPLDHRSDVFALGVVAWEVLAGERLFGRPTPYETIDAILHRPIPSFASLRPDLSPRAAAMLDRALQRDVSKRPSSAGELAEALRTATVRLAPGAPPPDLREAVRACASPAALRLAGLPAVPHPVAEAVSSEVTKVAKGRLEPTVAEDRGHESTAVAAWWKKRD
ncbi:MAG TPA: serine/threonine-protein kinase [Sandaracinaceae bacterium]